MFAKLILAGSILAILSTPALADMPYPAELGKKLAALERTDRKIMGKLKGLESRIDRVLLAVSAEAKTGDEEVTERKPGDTWQPNDWQTVTKTDYGTVTTPADRQTGAGIIVSFDRREEPYKDPVRLDEVPEWELTRKLGGSWTTDDAGNLVYALSRWRVKQAGKARVMEAIELYGRPVPVGAVIHGARTLSRGGGSSGQRRQPTASYNFGPQ
jgi:hypothetical protein